MTQEIGMVRRDGRGEVSQAVGLCTRRQFSEC